MIIPSSVQLLTLWEWAALRNPAERALALVSLTHPELSRDEIDHSSFGCIAAWLMQLRRQLFGSQIAVLTDCTQCRECIEICFDLSRLISIPEPSDAQLSVRCDGIVVQFRLPSGSDLVAISRCQDAVEARRELLKRCLIEIDPAARSNIDDLPESVIQAVATKMEQADTGANTRLEVTCPSCEHPSTRRFDIVNILWHEIDVWARRILREVHTLASKYHWSEAAILAMSPWRRQAYMELAGA